MAEITNSQTGIRTQVASADVSAFLWRQRIDAQRAAMRVGMGRPTTSSVHDSRSRRDDGDSTVLIIGSSGSCDISSAIRAANVVRSSPS